MSGPTITGDASKHFLRKDRKGPKIICKVCRKEIDLKPVRGINKRRRQHLDGCKNYPLKTGDYNFPEMDDFTSRSQNDDSTLMKVLIAVLVM